MIDRMVPSVMPKGAITTSMAATAAESGLAVIACWLATKAIDIGLSGLIPASVATSAITG